MLTAEERKIIEEAKASGKTKEQAIAALSEYRVDNPPKPSVITSDKKPLSNRIAETIGLGGAVDTFGSLLARQGVGAQTKEEGQQYIEKPTVGQIAGAAVQTAAVPASFLLTGGASLPAQMAVGAGLGYAYDVGQDLIEKKGAKDVLTPGLGTAIGAGAPPVFKGFSAAVGALKKPVTGVAETVTQKVAQAMPEQMPEVVQGTVQKGQELLERVPRFVGRVKEDIGEAAIKAEKIKTAPTPVIQQALKVDLPEKYINTIPQADPATKAAYKRVLDIADETPSTIGVKKNPTVVGGELAGKQYDVILGQQRKIGDEMNKVFSALPKEKTVPMEQAYQTLDDVLAEQGVIVNPTKKGFQFQYTGDAKITPKQRTVVEQLYKLAREGGDTMSPVQVHKRDQLFSALQREAKTDQIEDVLIPTPDGGKVSLFRVFRDVFNGQLDSFTPEIKKLNTQYRNISTLIDDVEDSIFKTPNFNVTKSADPAEFAKVNLRRIFGEAQSSPAYEAIADEMDTIARQLGYTDASPKEIAAFAQEIRELYPEAVPRTGFQGGFTRLLDVAEKVLGAGKADVSDQRKALRALIEQ